MTRDKGQRAKVDDLTQRELEVLFWLALGYTNSQIAELLTLSVRTVEGHRANIRGKLQLQSRAELTAFALEVGLVETPLTPLLGGMEDLTP